MNLMLGDSKDNSNFYTTLIIIVICKAVLCCIEIFVALLRYFAIRNDAITGDISYSRLMKIKLITSYLFGAIYLLPIILAFTVKNFWLNEHPFYSLIYLISTIIWVALGYLMKLEQERHLTQVWYCHKLFWVSN